MLLNKKITTVYDTYVGKTVWSRGCVKKGIIVEVTMVWRPYCGYANAYVIEWESGKITKNLCDKIIVLENGDFKIA